MIIDGCSTFKSHIAAFKRNNPPESIKEALEQIHLFFSREATLKHPREIYPIYRALNIVTQKVSESSINELKASWAGVLNTLDQRKVYRIGLGTYFFDVSTARKIFYSSMEEVKKSIVVAPVDLKDKNNVEAVVQYIISADREAFGACFQKGFIHELIVAPNVRCIAAWEGPKQKIIGILWGFFAESNGTQSFHIWELSRKASMAQAGIAHQLIECAKMQLSLYPKLQFATLNVHVENSRALKIYKEEDFKEVKRFQDTDRIFMSRRVSDSKAQVSADHAKTVVEKFIVNTIPLYKVLIYEIIRRCELLFRACWYR